MLWVYCGSRNGSMEFLGIITFLFVKTISVRSSWASFSQASLSTQIHVESLRFSLYSSYEKIYPLKVHGHFAIGTVGLALCLTLESEGVKS